MARLRYTNNNENEKVKDEGLGDASFTYEEEDVSEKVEKKKKFNISNLIFYLLLVIAIVFGGLFAKNYYDVMKHNQAIIEEEEKAKKNVDNLLGQMGEEKELPEVSADGTNPTATLDELGLKDGSGQITSNLEHKEEKEPIAQPSHQDDTGDLNTIVVKKPESSSNIDKLFDKYPDLYGWLTVGHVISVPLMKVENDDMANPMYLKKDINKASNEWGTPFMDNDATLGVSQNTPIYGHSGMTYGKTMFSPLMQFNFKEVAFPNKDITVTTRDGVYKYEIVYNYKSATWESTSEWEGDGIPITSVDLNKEDFSKMIDDIAEKSAEFYKGAEASEVKNSRIISLITCDVPFDPYTGRNFTIAREVSFTPRD